MGHASSATRLEKPIERRLQSGDPTASDGNHAVNMWWPEMDRSAPRQENPGPAGEMQLAAWRPQHGEAAGARSPEVSCRAWGFLCSRDTVRRVSQKVSGWGAAQAGVLGVLAHSNMQLGCRERETQGLGAQHERTPKQAALLLHEHPGGYLSAQAQSKSRHQLQQPLKPKTRTDSVNSMNVIKINSCTFW